MPGQLATHGVRRLLAVAACCLALAACADESRPPSPEESAVDDSPPPSPAPVPGAESAAAREAVADLARTLEVDPEEVSVVAVEEVTWRDGSRGCAQKGMLYTQALIDGSRITLQVDGTTYEYHSGGSAPPTLCERPTE